MRGGGIGGCGEVEAVDSERGDGERRGTGLVDYVESDREQRGEEDGDEEEEDRPEAAAAADPAVARTLPPSLSLLLLVRVVGVELLTDGLTWRNGIGF